LLFLRWTPYAIRRLHCIGSIQILGYTGASSVYVRGTTRVGPDAGGFERSNARRRGVQAGQGSLDRLSSFGFACQCAVAASVQRPTCWHSKPRSPSPSARLRRRAAAALAGICAASTDHYSPSLRVLAPCALRFCSCLEVGRGHLERGAARREQVRVGWCRALPVRGPQAVGGKGAMGTDLRGYLGERESWSVLALWPVSRDCAQSALYHMPTKRGARPDSSLLVRIRLSSR
jgi:hypothetical protein